ncbi:MAG TPA: multidrug transporter subunit MdtA, partial [Burkholderiaceae bacterium]
RPEGRPERGPRGGASAAAAPQATPAAAGEERPPWFDRMPPEMQEKYLKMTPEERKAWIEKRRAERAARGG